MRPPFSCSFTYSRNVLARALCGNGLGAGDTAEDEADAAAFPGGLHSGEGESERAGAINGDGGRSKEDGGGPWVPMTG